jgi:2-methylcitrate dehydratase PrpD
MTKAEALAKLSSQIDLSTQTQDRAKLIDRTKYLTLDFIGLAARGSILESSQPVIQFIEKFGGKGDVSVFARKDLKPLPQYAALANGTFSHSLELDDVTNEASLHPAVAIFPAAFAVGENMKVSGIQFLESVIYGYEVMVRLGKALNPSHIYSRGFHPTGVCGIFGAAAAASRIMNLTEEQMTNAFGIVGSQAAASMEFLETGAWTKRLHPGWAAHSGIIAAELAKNGFLGPSTIIEGGKGFAHGYSYDADLSQIGNEFSYEDNAILRTSIKPHACCRYKQGPLDLILKIVKDHELKPEEIHKVHVYLVKTALPIISEPADKKKNPRSSVDAQFSMPFGAAVAILYRKALLEEYKQQVVDSPTVKEMMNKVVCHHDPELDREFPKKWPARVVIESVKGTFSETIDYPKGDPENPLSWDELIEKFVYVTKPVYTEEQQQSIIHAVQNLEQCQNILELTRLL